MEIKIEFFFFVIIHFSNEKIRKVRGGFGYRLNKLQPRAANFGDHQILECGKFCGAANFREQQIWGSDKF